MLSLPMTTTTARYFVVFSNFHHLDEGNVFHGENTIKLTTPLTLVNLQQALCEDEQHRIDPNTINITGFFELTEEEYKTFLDKGKDDIVEPTSSENCNLM